MHKKRNEEKFFFLNICPKIMAKKRNEEKGFFQNICPKIMVKKGFGGFTKEARNFGGCGKTQNLGGLYFSSIENEQ